MMITKGLKVEKENLRPFTEIREGALNAVMHNQSNRERSANRERKDLYRGSCTGMEGLTARLGEKWGQD